MPHPPHKCPGDCNPRRMIDYSKLACRPCWLKLPLDLRRGLNAHPHDLELVGECIEWYRVNK